MEKINLAQKEFDEKYITSSEIVDRLKVERSTLLYARKRGYLPNAIVLKGTGTYIWERNKVSKHLKAWELQLRARRGELE